VFSLKRVHLVPKGGTKMRSHVSGESRRLYFNRSVCEAPAVAAAVLTILMASFCPAFSQAPSQSAQVAGDGNAQDDHSYLPPSMRSQNKSASSEAVVKA
jgi:hypothetical protein